MASQDLHENRRYMDLLHLQTPEEAYRQVKELASGLSDDDHLIRSCIFDFHAAVEVELRRIYYHRFKDMLFLTDDEKANEKIIKSFKRMIEGLSFMDMYRVLKPILNSWPYPDLESIEAINQTRIRAAHAGDLSKVLYKDRSPFKEPDCFAQMYFDVWAITQSMAKVFNRTIEEPKWKLRKYREQYGEL